MGIYIDNLNLAASAPTDFVDLAVRLSLPTSYFADKSTTQPIVQQEEMACYAEEQLAPPGSQAAHPPLPTLNLPNAADGPYTRKSSRSVKLTNRAIEGNHFGILGGSKSAQSCPH